MTASHESLALIMHLLDVLLGRLLDLPRDVTILLITLLTVGLLTLIRRLATNQDQLRRCAADWRQLKQLRREARQHRDRDVLARTTRTMHRIQVMRLKADLIVLSIAILPLGLLAMWAAERLEYLPTQTHEPLELTAYYSMSSVGRLTHLVPRPDMQLESPTVQTVRIDDQDVRRGRVRWVFRATRRTPQFVLIVRHARETAEHPMRISSTRYEPPALDHAGNTRLLRTEVSLERYKFLGIDPQLDRFGLPPWLVAYVVLSMTLLPIVRRLTWTA